MARVGLKLTLMARSSVSATTMAMPRMPPMPRPSETMSRFGSASSISAASRPPIRIKGRRRPFQNQTRSEITPMITCPMIPASGPAAHTRPTSWMSRPYCVVSIQLSAEICIDSANPMAVAGSASTAKNELVFSCWKVSIPGRSPTAAAERSGGQCPETGPVVQHSRGAAAPDPAPGRFGRTRMRAHCRMDSRRQIGARGGRRRVRSRGPRRSREWRVSWGATGTALPHPRSSPAGS